MLGKFICNLYALLQNFILGKCGCYTVAHSTFSPPPFDHAPCCSAPHRPLLCCRCPSQISHPELSDRAKRSDSSSCPSCTKGLPAAPASKARPWDLPAVIFLREHLTGSCLRRLFPHPHRPRSELYVAKELRPDPLYDHLDHSLGTSPVSPPHQHAHHRRITSPSEHPIPGLPSVVFM
jgi:hypothetical protein